MMFDLSELDPSLLEITVASTNLVDLDRALESRVRMALSEVASRGSPTADPAVQLLSDRFFTALAQALARGGKTLSSTDELLQLVPEIGASKDLLFAACACVFEPEYEEVYRKRLRCTRPSTESHCGGDCGLCQKRGHTKSRSRKTKSKRRRLQDSGGGGTPTNGTAAAASQESSSSPSENCCCCQIQECVQPDVDVDDDHGSHGRYVWTASVKLRWSPSEQWKRSFCDRVQVLSAGRIQLTFVDQAQRRAAEASVARATAEQLKAAQPDLAASAAAAAAALAAETAAAAPSPPSTPVKGKHGTVGSPGHGSPDGGDASEALQSSLLEPVIAYARECLFCIRSANEDHLVRFSPQYLLSFAESPFTIVHSIDRRAVAASPSAQRPAAPGTKKKAGLMSSCNIQ